MWYSIGSLGISLLLLFPPYWPGGTQRWSSSPTYGPVIPVFDTLGVKDEEARRQWNACGSVRLVSGHGPEFAPGTITIVKGKLGDWPRGGWFADHGVLFLQPGWGRSIPVIRHELGHALGFGHTKLDSVMGSSNNVQAIDCKGLVHYYGR